MARFDWYQASVTGEVAAIRQALLEGACDGRAKVDPMRRAPHGYAFGEVVSDMDGQVGMIWWGGMHSRPHVVSSGEAAPLVSDVLRGQFGSGAHSVSRVDVCEDYSDPGAYDVLQAHAIEVARECRVKVGTAGDHLLTKTGRTCYLGGTKSHTRLRIYDKAAELREKFANDPKRLADVPAELARFELQVRPQTPEAKLAAASADPVALMGSSAWSRQLVQRVDGLSLEPFQAGRVWRQSDDDRALAAMCAQYGGVLGRLCQALGSWECVGLQIGHDLAEKRTAKRMGR